MEPACIPSIERAAIASAPGLSESHTPSDQPTVRWPSEAAIGVTQGLRKPCGARKCRGRTPEARMICSVPRVTSQVLDVYHAVMGRTVRP
jgi:hypothetical protein